MSEDDDVLCIGGDARNRGGIHGLIYGWMDERLRFPLLLTRLISLYIPSKDGLVFPIVLSS